MRVLAARGTRGAIAVQHLSQLQPVEARAVRDQRFPARRPAEVAHQLARQAEGKVEAADPRPGAPQGRVASGEGFESIDVLQVEDVFLQDADGDGDRLRPARRAGEVVAVDPHSRYFAFQSTYFSYAAGFIAYLSPKSFGSSGSKT